MANGSTEFKKAVLSDVAASAPGAIPDKIEAALSWVNAVSGKLQMQFVSQECFDLLKSFQAVGAAPSKDNKVIDIPAVQVRFKFPLHEVVKRAHVDERIELAEQVADWDAKWLCVRVPIFGKLEHHADKSLILDAMLDQGAQHGPVNAVKKLSDVQLHHARAGINGAQRFLRIVGSFVSAFAMAACKRLVYEPRIENRVSQPVDGMLHHQVTECRCINDALFGLIHMKFNVRHGLVAAAIQFLIERVQIAGKPARKLKACAFFHLPMASVNPCLVKRLAAESLIK